ncbi:glycoside hydrolase family 99-like domain-containing protein [Haloarchaeobius salinus]|uniref:glycoside hydrolase family 99-like domain-containing protein n=1 Tax=Haloarchaeobius salinus TaxID=1198298 RepID=UPI00210A4848|nr:glycoside hydrolase family 99-like domain-containing protein [Haloarchaeobius salinus]
MPDRRRRDLLQSAGVLGISALAGCQGGSEDPAVESAATGSPTTPTSTRATTESGGEVAFTLQTASELGGDATQLSVTGTVEATTALQAVTIAVADQRRRVDAEAANRLELDTTVAVDGGQRYEVTVTATDESGAEATTSIRTEHVPIHVDPVDTDRLVGAHYYPWYETRGHANWTDRIVSEPVLGEYAGSDPAVVDQHLKWCLEHGIRWLSLSWWGPDTGTDDVIQRTLLPRERFDDLEFSILYETKGRLEGRDYDLDDAIGRGILVDDFRYLAEHYFGRENYLHLDERPVVFVYLADNLRGDLVEAFEAVEEAIGVRPYILADVAFGGAPGTAPVGEVADGFTAYNPYFARSDIESIFHDRYERGNEVLELGAEALDADHVPVVMPGFNDTGLPASIREDNPILSSTPERYERVLEQVDPHLATAPAVLVTSFNEWYENTQVEPDEEFGTRYLELTRDRLATGQSAGFDPDGATFSLAFNRTAAPAAHRSDSDDSRELAFQATELSFQSDGETVVSYDIGGDASEPIYLDGVYGASSDDDSSWRWFGGADARTTMFVEAPLEAADTAVLTGQPVPFVEVEVDVSLDGERTDHVVLNRPGTSDYELSLTAPDDS